MLEEHFIPNQLVYTHQELSMHYCGIPWTKFAAEHEKPPHLRAEYQPQLPQVLHAVK